LVSYPALAASDGAFRTMTKVPPVKNGPAPFDEGESGAALVGLDCSGAVEISLDNVYNGTNVGAPNNVSAYACSPWNESGGEVVFHLYLAQPGMYEAFIETGGCDLDLAVLDQCDADLGCQIVVDSGVSTNVPLSGDFYFVVDGYGGAECDFTFTINSLAPPEPVDFCADVEQATGTYFTGSTCGGVNAVSSLGCEDFGEDGLEVYYEIFMPAGGNFTADVTNTADGALWVVDSCSDPISCLAYADNTFTGETESVYYSNDTGSDTIVYLVVDSYGSASCGDYEMTITATSGVIATENSSFGVIKSLYR
jgi:hypothetical protein